MSRRLSAHGFRQVEPGTEPEPQKMSLRTLKSKLKEASEVRALPDSYSDLLAALATELNYDGAYQAAIHFSGPLGAVARDVLDVIETLDEEELGSKDESGFVRPIIRPLENEEQREMDSVEAAFAELLR